MTRSGAAAAVRRTVDEETAAAKTDARAWAAVLAQYRQPDPVRSALEIAITAIPFAALWALAAFAVLHGHYWGLLLTVPAAGFLVRLFILQHDCGHGSLFSYRGLNDWTGRIIGVFTLTPYDYWRRTHAVHHASAGNLDRRGVGDVDTLTVREYQALSRWGRLGYRLYRHPLVMFGLGPAWLFICQYRLPFGLMSAGAQPWVSTIATNLGIALPVVALVWMIGLGPFLLVQVPVTLMAASAGVWLFYIQHQFEDTHWSDQDEWTFPHAALHGSSHYDLPVVLRWISGNIGIHHVHHLAAKIPFYRLPEVLRDHPELQDMSRITLRDSFKCVKLALWDESARRLVSFREARAAA
ncbi:fatty acid desaturase [Roseibium suaedae]|uniref:Omega-6 fatty acid desaturase (Delta-12 desaturase) n=1 Tax=Roseibium suaedae TaxID=735517 RepID=A0A1M7D1K7_9HYPH|nr:fatty acid desaturase [Roseibium suaedae]SHL73402.1 omega-6 fatty acid desaturase (delta-12 desaturase) [Roseibium suaedae]